jgi:hypothetical protein
MKHSRSAEDDAVAARAGLGSGIAEVMAFGLNYVRHTKARLISSMASTVAPLAGYH